jgi:hypothetical protein
MKTHPAFFDLLKVKKARMVFASSLSLQSEQHTFCCTSTGILVTEPSGKLLAIDSK